MTPLFARLTSEQAHTYSLVLSATAIAHRIHRIEGTWSITVPQQMRGPAQRSIAAYLSENQPPVSMPVLAGFGSQRTFSAVFIVIFLGAIHGAIGSDQQLFFSVFGADAAQIMDGQLYRCATALLLHSDWSHLAANAAFTLVFGTAASTFYGWGVGWLLILISGMAGNLATAWWYQSHHLSVGASTAVFAALGICTATTLWMRWRIRSGTWRTWMPLAAGLALVGWLGTSPRADLVAHFFGFCFGILAGAVYLKCIGRRFSWPVQAAACTAALVMVGACLFWGYLIKAPTGKASSFQNRPRSQEQSVRTGPKGSGPWSLPSIDPPEYPAHTLPD